jgi:hypothetical protein
MVKKTWFIENEIRDYCKKATNEDKYSMYIPLFNKGKWRLTVRSKPGVELKPGVKPFAYCFDLGHPYTLVKLVEGLSIISKLYPGDAIMGDQEKMLETARSLATNENQKSPGEIEWEQMIKDWQPGDMA